jgi:CHAT domain-containing protein
MNLGGRMRVVACLISIGLLAATTAEAQSARLQDLIAEHEARLGDARAASKAKDEVVELNVLATLYRQAGQAQKALDYCNQALPIEERLRFHTGVALTKDTMGRIYTDTGEEQKALDLFNEILPFWESGHNFRRAALVGESRLFKQGKASTLNNLGRVYNNLGDKQRALIYLGQALPIWIEIGNPAGQASTLDNMGRAYADMGRGSEALDYLNRALALWGGVGELGGEGLTLCNIGKVYADLGQKQKALESYNNALANFREIGNREGEANALNYRGKVYTDIGQAEKALDDLNQALPLWREVGMRSGEALALNDIGRVYSNLGQARKALEFYNRALPIWRATKNRRGEAATLTNMGRDCSALGDQNKALEFDYASLSAWREVQDRRGQAFALNSIGRVYSELGQREKALSCKLAALSLARAADDPDIQGGIESSLMIDFRDQHRPEEAIFFGMGAVNSYQRIRKNISGLDKELQSGFSQAKSATYRALAELLVQADRLGEAEQVLDLLKEQELKEVVRGADTSGAKVEPLKLASAQQTAQSELATPEKTALAVAEMSAEYAELQAKTTRTPEESARLQMLEAKIESGNSEVSEFFKKTLYPQLAEKAGARDANAVLSQEKSEVSRLQNTLAELGPPVLGVRMLLGEERAYVIVVTAQARKKFELKATSAQLRSKVLEVRDDLRTPSADPRPHLAELYAMVVAPWGGELSALEQPGTEKGRVPTVLWSLDGVMRYLPMAALYDGHHYLVERFNNVLFTPESYGHMATSSGANSPALRVLAMGLSKSYGGLPPLPGVLPELNAVAHDPEVPESHGPMAGRLLSNEQFTMAALKTHLAPGQSFPVVHIASHFVEEVGGDDEPYLMLGGENSGVAEGYALTLSKLEDSTITFHGTQLLTLSACSTAKGDAAKDGLEMDSLGMIAQHKDAEAVLASLWDVNDVSTSRLMSDFYARWVKQPSSGKAEALRQAQLAFLQGSPVSTSSGSDRGVQVMPESIPAAHETGYAHPFYWAPFVLIGNYQ